MARKHTVDEVLKALSRKNDVRIKDDCIEMLNDEIYDRKQKKFIQNPKKHFDIGNGSWGKIDFLCNYHGFWIYYVDEFKGRSR